VPEQRAAKVTKASVTCNYTAILNLVFLAVALCCRCGSCAPAAQRYSS